VDTFILQEMPWLPLSVFSIWFMALVLWIGELQVSHAPRQFALSRRRWMACGHIYTLLTSILAFVVFGLPYSVCIKSSLVLWVLGAAGGAAAAAALRDLRMRLRQWLLRRGCWTPPSLPSAAL
jgi:hypothetical protein